MLDNNEIDEDFNELKNAVKVSVPFLLRKKSIFIYNLINSSFEPGCKRDCTILAKSLLDNIFDVIELYTASFIKLFLQK